MRNKPRNWLAGVSQRIGERGVNERDWLIDLQVQIGVQDMERDAARIADEERAARMDDRPM